MTNTYRLNLIPVKNKRILQINEALNDLDPDITEHWSGKKPSTVFLSKQLGFEVFSREIDYCRSLWIGDGGITYELKNVEDLLLELPEECMLFYPH